VTDVTDVRTDEGLRAAVREVARCASWEIPAGWRLLTELRVRSARRAAAVSRRVSVDLSVELVDDMMSLAWELLATQTQSVLGAEQPWAYLMSAAAQALTNEARAQRYLTGNSTIRGAGRVHVPRHVNPIGAAAAEVETELYGHAAATCPESPRPVVAGTKRASWLDAFVDLLAEHGADPAVTSAAVDRISELAETTSAWRETVVRRDQVLSRLGLCPDQAGALSALVFGSRRSGRSDGLLKAVLDAHQHGNRPGLTPAQQQRVRTYVGGPRPAVSTTRTQPWLRRALPEPALVAS
jgi:hypothetical protein